VRCAICEAAEEGRPLTADQIEMYNLGKRGMRPLSLVNVSEELTTHAGEKFTLRSLGAAIGHALGFPKKEEAIPPSVNISKNKVRGRLFDGVDLEERPEGAPIGSMESVDAALVAAKEKG